MKKLLALLLALLLLLSLCACGRDNSAAFRSLGVIGTKQYGSICRSGDKLAEVIDAALLTLAGSGKLASLVMSRFGEDRCCLEGDVNALRALGELPEPRTLIFGIESEFYPLGYTENGAPTGLGADIAEAIGELLGWDIMVLNITSDTVEAQLASGNVDCVLCFDIGLVSASKYAVGNCFLESDILLAVRTDSEIKRIKDLNSCRVGTVSDPSVLKAIRSSEKLTKYASGATQYLSISRCFEALDKNWCSAVAMDSIMLYYYRGT